MALIGSKKRKRAAQIAVAAKAAKALRDAGSDKESSKGRTDSGDSSGGRLRWLLIGAGLGAVAYYFLDPVSGRSRRAETAQQAAAGVRQPLQNAGEELQKTATVARDRASGLVAEATSPDSAPDDDRALVNKVRSEALGGEAWSDATINVNAVDGVVTLRGELETRERIEQAIDAVQGVSGVERVESFLHQPGDEAPNVAEVRGKGGGL